MIVVLKSLIKPKQEKVMLTGKCSFEINSNIQGSRKRLDILLIIKLWPYTSLGTRHPWPRKWPYKRRPGARKIGGHFLVCQVYFVPKYNNLYHFQSMSEIFIFVPVPYPYFLSKVKVQTEGHHHSATKKK